MGCCGSKSNSNQKIQEPETSKLQEPVQEVQIVINVQIESLKWNFRQAYNNNQENDIILPGYSIIQANHNVNGVTYTGFVFNYTTLTIKYKTKLNKIMKFEYPNLVPVGDVYLDDNKLYLITPNIGNHTLIKVLGEHKMTEFKIARVMDQLLRGLSCLHNNQIAHKNISPSSLLFPEKKGLFLQVGDYFLPQKISKLANKVSKLSYKSPQQILGKKSVNNEDLGKEDVWACGVILYHVLTGYQPFTGKTIKEIQGNILKGVFNTELNEWEALKEDVKDLLKQMLAFQVRNRPTAAQCLSHKWFDILKCKPKQNQKLKYFEKQIFNNLQNYTALETIQYATVIYMTQNFATNKEKEKFRMIFQDIDVDHNGLISKEELYQSNTIKNKVIDYLKVLPSKKAEKEVERIFKQIDTNNSGSIDYNEFLVATIDKKVLFQKDRIEKVFKVLDTDNSGSLTLPEVREFLKNLNIPDQDIKKIIAGVDLNRDGQISLNEFKSLMNTIIEDLD